MTSRAEKLDLQRSDSRPTRHALNAAGVLCAEKSGSDLVTRRLCGRTNQQLMLHNHELLSRPIIGHRRYLPAPTNALLLCASIVLQRLSHLVKWTTSCRTCRSGRPVSALGHARRAHAPSATIDFRSPGKVSVSLYVCRSEETGLIERSNRRPDGARLYDGFCILLRRR